MGLDSGAMDNETLVDAVDSDGRRLLEVAGESMGAPIPHIEGWDVTQLVRHIGQVYTYIGGLLDHVGSTEAPEVGRGSPPDTADDLLAWAGGLHGELVTKLRTTDPSAPAWNWAGTGTAAFFPRRMAHETLVHRFDAEAAAGAVTAIDSDLGADGVDELIEVGLRRSFRGDREHKYPEGSLHLHRTDGEGEWLLRTEDGGVVSTREHAKGDAAVRGTGDNLMLYMWGRGGNDLDILGDEAVAAAWTTVAP